MTDTHDPAILGYSPAIDPSSDLMRGVVARWKVLPWYGSGPRLVDISGFRKVGTLNGATWNTRPSAFSSLRFNGTSSSVDFDTIFGSFFHTGEVTVSAWMAKAAPSGSAMEILSNYAGSGDYNLVCEVDRTDSVASLLWGGVVVVTGSIAIAASRWTHVVWQRSGSAGNWTAKLWVNGVPSGTGTTATDPGPTPGGVVLVGRLRPDDFALDFNGLLDDITVWNRAITDAEVRQLYEATSQREDPTLNWIRPATMFGVSAGGTDYTLDAAGSSTATGTLVKAVLKELAGSCTPTGALAKAMAKSLAGSLTATGTLARQTQKPLAGSVTGTAALAKQTSKAFAGSSTPTGDLGAISVKLLALDGSLTPEASLVKQAGKGAAGSATPTGGITSAASKPLAGSTTPTGSLAKQAQKPFDGSSTPTGDLTPLSVKLLAIGRSVTAVASLVKDVFKYLAGFVTGTGTLTTSGGTIPSTVLIDEDFCTFLLTLLPAGVPVEKGRIGVSQPTVRVFFQRAETTLDLLLSGISSLYDTTFDVEVGSLGDDSTCQDLAQTLKGDPGRTSGVASGINGFRGAWGDHFIHGAFVSEHGDDYQSRLLNMDEGYYVASFRVNVIHEGA